MLPGILDMFFHSCEHGRRWQYLPYTSARVFEDFPFPLVPRMIPHLHKTLQKNNLGPDVREKLAMVAFVYQPSQSNFQ